MRVTREERAMNKIASVRGVAAPTVEELVARARELKPLLSKNGPLGETDRRVVEESIEAARTAGLFKVCTPKRYGGWEMNTRAMLDVSSAVAEADGGTAWVVNLNNICCWLAALFPVRAQDEVFGANPDVRISGVLNPTATAKKVDVDIASPANGTTFRAVGTRSGRGWACRSSMRPARRSTKASRYFRWRTSRKSILGSSPA
jgi:Acyl-CoA dehydrogenase, N-terminal domain